MPSSDLFTIAFPSLSASQVASLAKCGAAQRRAVPDGEYLFRAGQRDFNFFVVAKGLIEIIDRSGDQPRRIATHGPGEFTGDVGHLTGGYAIADAIARDDCEVIEIATTHLRELIGSCPDLGDILLQAFIARRQMLHESEMFVGLRVIGSRFSKDTFRVREFLAKNRGLFTWVDLEDDPAVDLMLKKFGLGVSDTPVVMCGDGKLLLKNPTNKQLGEAVGLRRPLEDVLYDLAVIGAGPAGLAAAVYGASEGLNTVVLERAAPGGQAGSSMRIENYLGFPTGLTGRELADRATMQANKFGAKLNVPTVVAGLDFEGPMPVAIMDDGVRVTAKCLLIATGADYRKLEVEGCEQYEGRGVYYAATPNEAQQCKGAEVAVVGAGNSAGQAAVFLSSHARKVYLIVRGDDLMKNMSSYLAHRIQTTATIEVLYATSIQCLGGDGTLATVDVKTGDATRQLTLAAVFSFIGAVPRTDWLPDAILKDDKGFVRTGPGREKPEGWTLKREPFLLETSRPGVFAAGDVRAGSVKRVASAVGEGSMAVQFVHEYLKTV